LKRLICLLLAFACLVPAAIAAQSTTYTWALNNKGEFVHTQDAYLPDRTVTHLMLKEPEDLYIASDGYMYISDSGNGRIVVYDTATSTVVKEIRHEQMQRPRGIFVTSDLDLYVADSAAAVVFRFNKDGELIQTFARPESAAFGDTQYAPKRVAVDNRGSLYIIGEGVYNGVIQLSVTGEFLGFFTTNRVTLSFIQILQNIFFTEVQKQSLQDRTPGVIENVHTDKDGIVYTVTMGREGRDNIKKHNMRGGNMFTNGVLSFSNLSDITTDQSGIIYVTDSLFGYVSAYSPYGDFIFEFGGYSTEDVAGYYSYLTSVAVERDGTLWTLDSIKAYLQSYKPTEYTNSIYTALALFDQGRYDDAEGVWNNVLRYNQSSVLAHDGIGKAGLYTQDYENAREHFELSGNRTFYSQAFWELRNNWLQENLIWFLIALVILILALAVLRTADHKKLVKSAVGGAAHTVAKVPVIRDVVFAFSVMRHPLDGYYDLKRKIRGSAGGAAFLYFLLFAALTVNQVGKAFILQTTAAEDMNLAALVGGFIGAILLFVVCNYLVSSINDGEGTIGDVFKLVAYASMPLTLSFILITVLSYVLTFNEVFLVSFIQTGGILWFCVTLYLGLQEMHNYNVWNTVKSILFTAGFIAIAVIALLILTILFQQTTQFVEAVGREVYYNATGTI
jgi:DNA-binding beta-propeller fold protein YncE